MQCTEKHKIGKTCFLVRIWEPAGESFSSGASFTIAETLGSIKAEKSMTLKIKGATQNIQRLILATGCIAFNTAGWILTFKSASDSQKAVSANLMEDKSSC